MKWEDEFDDLLRDVRREHRAIEPPEKLEPALLAKMQQWKINAQLGRPVLMRRRAWAWGMAAVFAGLALWGGMAWRSHSSKEHETSLRVAHTPQTREPTVDAHVAVEPVKQPTRRHEDQAQETRRSIHETAREAARAADTGTLDMFIALPTSEGLPPPTQLSLVRVTLMGSDLQQYGLETPPEAAARSLLAEFVVGEDGLPRAIRIVQ